MGVLWDRLVHTQPDPEGGNGNPRTLGNGDFVEAQPWYLREVFRWMLLRGSEVAASLHAPAGGSCRHRVTETPGMKSHEAPSVTSSVLVFFQRSSLRPLT